MPWIIEYNIVLEQMRRQRFKCRYHNSGAFAFAEGGVTVGWMGPEDESIRAEARALVHQAEEPYAENLVRALVGIWQKHLAGRVWVMPMSHWAFELTHGNPQWMPALIESIDLDPGLLEGRNNAAAIEFAPEEAAAFSRFVEKLLLHLRGSDFMIAFPDRPALCMLHHHTQLWWTVEDPALAAVIVAAIQEGAADAGAETKRAATDTAPD